MAFSSWLTSSWFDTPSKPMTHEERVTRAIKHAESFGKAHKIIPVFTEQEGKSTITIPNGASKLSHDELIDKIRGIIYGQAMGDAIGLYTEFHDREWCHHHYGQTPMTMNRSIRGWDVGDWTDDTDQMLLILDGVIRWNGDIKHTDFAHRLWYWVQHGYPELGDYSGNGCGGVVSASVRSDGFLTDPHACARQVYAESNGRAAANGAVMRTSILGIPHFYDTQHVINQTLQISNVTHADPRCAASVVACTTAIALMLQGGVYDPAHPETIENVLAQAEKLATAQLTPEYDSDELHKHLNAEKLSDLELDESAKIGYTYKCIGSGFWATRYGTDFRTTITEIVLEGGDADTNGAVAGAMLGCKLGFKALPKEWLSTLANRDWLEHRITHFLGLLGLDEIKQETSCISNDASISVPVSDDTATSTSASITPDADTDADSVGMNDTSSTVIVPA